MKPKKALKRLKKIEALLTKVRQQLPGRKDGLADLLDSAKTAVQRAKRTMMSQASTKVSRKPAAKADTASPGRLTEAGRKRISRAAKRRWAAAKRRGINAVTGHPLSRTA